MNKLREEKIRVAREIIALSKKLGFERPLPSGQHVTPEILANAQTLPELRKVLHNIQKAVSNRR